MQSKHAIKKGRVEKQGKKALKALAFKAEGSPALGAVTQDPETSPAALSPVSASGSDMALSTLAVGAETGDSPSHRAGSSNSPSSGPKQDEDVSPVAAKAASTVAVPASKDRSNTKEEGNGSSAVPENDAVPKLGLDAKQGTPKRIARSNKASANVQTDPAAEKTDSTPSKRPLGLSAIHQAGAAVPGTDSTPSKATPSKRGREAVGGSPGTNAGHGTEGEGGLKEGTPGKRRRSLLPPAMLTQPSGQVQLFEIALAS